MRTYGKSLQCEHANLLYVCSSFIFHEHFVLDDVQTEVLGFDGTGDASADVPKDLLLRDDAAASNFGSQLLQQVAGHDDLVVFWSSVNDASLNAFLLHHIACCTLTATAWLPADILRLFSFSGVSFRLLGPPFVNCLQFHVHQNKPLQELWVFAKEARHLCCCRHGTLFLFAVATGFAFVQLI